MPLLRQSGFWEAKVTQCVDTFKNYWLKCPKEKPFWRPVEEVLQWTFIDEPMLLPDPPTVAPAVDPSAIAPPTGESPPPAAAKPEDNMPLSQSQPASDLEVASAALMACDF
jgi:hypothetical protein